MIKDYLYAIGKYLPLAQREEILKEIESNLFDYIEDKYGIKKEYSKEEIEEAILKMGSPMKVAESYNDKPIALIGFPLLNTYYLLLKIIIPAVALGLSIAKLISFDKSSGVLIVIFKLLGEIWFISLNIVGIMTIIFGLIYKYIPSSELIGDKEWSVRDLEKAPDSKDRIAITDLVFEIFFSVIFILILNIEVPNEITMSILPVVNKELISPYLPFINGIILITIILNIYLLIKRKWENKTRIISIILDISGVFIFGIISFNTAFFDLSKISELPMEDMNNLVNSVQIGLRIGFTVIVIVVFYSIYKHIKAMIR